MSLITVNQSVSKGRFETPTAPWSEIGPCPLWGHGRLLRRSTQEDSGGRRVQHAKERAQGNITATRCRKGKLLVQQMPGYSWISLQDVAVR